MQSIKFLFPIFFSILSLTVTAQNFTNSNLPIVIISTDLDPLTRQPILIPDEPKVLANMKIIYRSDGSRNFLTDINNPEFLNYNGRIGIEIRGSSSQALEKKPYSLTTLAIDNISNNNVALLGLPSENDWVLNSLAFDPSLIRDYISYNLSTAMGNYASRGIYCEVIVNDDYRGLYVLMEKLKIDENRINIAKLTPFYNSGENLTGGYITKCDKTNAGDPVAWNDGWGADFIHESPKPTEITSQQSAYIKGYFTGFYNTMLSRNSSISYGYPSMIDIPSFVDFMLMNELTSNVDGYQFSTFFNKDRNGKLRAGPIWDFNLTYGNDIFEWGFDRSFTNVWQFNDGGNMGARFWRDLYNDATFKCYLTKRWLELTVADKALNYNIISTKIDQVVSLISEAANREQNRWYRVGDQALEIINMKTWIQNRISWLNNNLNNCQACLNVPVPPLVISKIHYHPKFDTYQADSLEFIEISNNSNVTQNLTGVYFSEPGFTYQFPINSSIGPSKKIIVASNSNNYKHFYGETPFGQYSRNLSNKSQKLVLADAYGNVIDHVEYSDSYPWPVEADGTGSWLDLIDLNFDNSLAENWTVSNNKLNATNNLLYDNIQIYPNPTNQYLNISIEAESILEYHISDLLGRVILSGNSTNKIDVDKLTPNIYIINFGLSNGTRHLKRFVKSK